jgi:hypothetical protein
MAIIILTCLPGGPAHAQSGTDVSPAIPVHPDVPTVLQLPDRIERAWLHYGTGFRVKGVGSKVYVRPRRGTPVDAEALLEVKTGTMHRIFLLRVVARAEDATRTLVARAEPAPAHVDGAGRTAGEPAPAAPAATAPSTAPAPGALAPPAITPDPAPAHAVPEPRAPEPASATDEEPAPATAPTPRFELSLHAFVGAGFVGLDLAGSEPQVGFQPLHAVGLRLAGARPGARWGLEASISGERPAGAMTYKKSDASLLAVSGPWLRAEMDLRTQLARGRWTHSVCLGVGAQTHLRQTEERRPSGRRVSLVSTMEHGATATLGARLQYRGRKVLWGLEFQVRRGVPDDYHAEVALWTIGFFPEQEHEP